MCEHCSGYYLPLKPSYSRGDRCTEDSEGREGASGDSLGVCGLRWKESDSFKCAEIGHCGTGILGSTMEQRCWAVLGKRHTARGTMGEVLT